MKYYLTDSNDEVHGPYGLEEITNLRTSGKVEPTALLCEEGSETWQPVASILPPTAPVAAKVAGVPQAAPPESPATPVAKTPPQAKPAMAPAPASPAPREIEAQDPEAGVNSGLLAGIVIGLALILVAAYLFGRRL